MSPGATPGLLAHMLAIGLLVLPGVATAGEVMMVLPQVQFCPTGGVSLASAHGYLELPNVSCVGGSWLTPKAAIENNGWEQITKLAREAAGLVRD